MNADQLGESRFLNILFKPAGAIMESRLRRWLFDPRRTVRGAELKPGHTVLEVGCGTGFFTLLVADLIGDNGQLIAMEPLSGYADKVLQKVKDAGSNYVEVVKRDALKTGLKSASIDVVLLFGVIPFPTLPLSKLLPEMHKVLREGGTLAVWLFPVSFGVPTSILNSGLFTDLGKKDGVYRFRRA